LEQCLFRDDLPLVVGQITQHSKGFGFERDALSVAPHTALGTIKDNRVGVRQHGQSPLRNI
jgi:hypothetical protein